MAKIERRGRFYEILESMAETYARKSHDYAEESDPLSNFKEVAVSIGATPLDVIRMFIATKQARIKQLAKKGENFVIGESIKDSFLDLAVYSVLGMMVLEEEEKKNRVDKNRKI